MGEHVVEDRLPLFVESIGLAHLIAVAVEIREEELVRWVLRRRPYLDAGFTGFTFNNNIYRTPEAIGVIGELLRLVAGAEPVSARAGA